jgi:hypothetical protein
MEQILVFGRLKMSRSYTFAVEVAPVRTEEEAEQIRDAVDEEMGSETQYYLGVTETDIGTIAYIDGETRLCGGENEREANRRLCSSLFEQFSFLKTAETKWLCTEYQEWDETYSNFKDEYVDDEKEED